MWTLLTILTLNWSNPTLTAFPIWIQLYLNLTRHTSWNQPLKYPPPLPASVWFKPLCLRHFVFMFAYSSMLECVLLFLHLFVHLFYFCIFIYMCIFFNCASFLFVHLFYLCIFFSFLCKVWLFEIWEISKNVTSTSATYQLQQEQERGMTNVYFKAGYVPDMTSQIPAAKCPSPSCHLARYKYRYPATSWKFLVYRQRDSFNK